ncbi:MAG TPA: hypothetical protein VJU86_02465 [Pyrinomonadaceae bacterium]|nr:hypothetical protein [Pyrinomonadaceae bacterium]
MASDPGFSSDTCIFMEAAPGDGGAHNGNSVWWLSPDLSLTGPTSGIDQADSGQINKIRVKFRRKPESSGCTFPGAESITVEVWVANPSIAMVPFDANSCRRVGFIGSPLPLEGTSGTQLIDWNPRVGLPATDPESKGQKCLIARAYPDNLFPNATRFFVPDDQHVVQHNLSVTTCDPRGCSFKVSTANPLAREGVLRIKLKAQFDPNPSNFVRTMVLKRLQSTPGFQQIATQPPSSFGFDFTGVSQLGTIQLPSGPTVTTPTTTETEISLAGRPITFQFVAKFSHGSGFAHIFHLTQASPVNVPQGGLTLVMLAL